MTTVTFISPYQAETFIAALGIVVQQGQSFDLPDDAAATLLSAPTIWAGTLGVTAGSPPVEDVPPAVEPVVVSAQPAQEDPAENPLVED